MTNHSPSSDKIPQHGVRVVEVDSDSDGQRIDNFLQRILKGVPKSRVYRLLRRGEVRVNRGRKSPDYRLQTGDQVRIPPLRQEIPNTPRTPPQSASDDLQRAILWENDDCLVLNKPAGIAVHKGSGVEFGVIELLRAARPGAYLELAHRLDRDTSGCLLLVKTGAARREVHTLLVDNQINKGYLTLVRGHWDLGRHQENASLARNILRGGERMVEVDSRGKNATTRFKPVSLHREASLLEVEIATGRTHQIRVHASHLGHPVAGDDKYGDNAFNKAMHGYGLRRLFLHAHRLILYLNRREVAVDAPLSDDLRGVLERIQTR